jgi:hypothetical protein
MFLDTNHVDRLEPLLGLGTSWPYVPGDYCRFRSYWSGNHGRLGLVLAVDDVTEIATILWVVPK